MYVIATILYRRHFVRDILKMALTEFIFTDGILHPELCAFAFIYAISNRNAADKQLMKIS